MAKRRFGLRMVRGIFSGILGGLGGGLGLMFICMAINAVAGSQVLDPTAFLLLGAGIGIMGATAYEMSEEMNESENKQ